MKLGKLMYQLYYMQGACSLATQVVLRELEQQVELIDSKQLKNFKTINVVENVPVLVDQDKVLTEGAAIMLYLLNKHESSLFPRDTNQRESAIQNIMFANATMHPAYSKLFFIAAQPLADSVKNNLFASATQTIKQLWSVVENELINKPFLGGDSPSAADIMLTVYSRWGSHFPVDITFGQKTLNMIQTVQSMPSFIKSDAAEAEISSNMATET